MTLSLFPMLGTIWGLGEVGVLLARRSKSSDTSMDRGSLRLIFFVTAASISLGAYIAYHFPIGRLGYSHLFNWLAVCFIVSGIILRWYSIFYLGRFFSPKVVIADDHQLIDSGPYRLIRHPCYTGAILSFLGFGLSMRNLGSVLIMMVPIFCVMLWRIWVEEEALLKAFGERYRNYMQKTKRLIPFVY